MRIITGFLGGRILKTVEGKGYRPAMGKVREALFSRLESYGIEWENIKVLDVFAGTGSLAFEAISRGAISASFIELDSKAVDCLNHNIKNLDIQDQCKVFKNDAGKILGRTPNESFQLIFVDPPYGEKKLTPTLNHIMKNGWLDKDGYFVAEIEDAVKFNPEIEGLKLLADKVYGQTRVLLWQKTI